MRLQDQHKDFTDRSFSDPEKLPEDLKPSGGTGMGLLGGPSEPDTEVLNNTTEE